MNWWLQTLKESDIKSHENDNSSSSTSQQYNGINQDASQVLKRKHGMMLPYLLVVERIVDGVAQSRDKVGFWYQRHTLLDQKLCLGKVTKNKQAGKKGKKTEAEEYQRRDSKFLRGDTIKVNNSETNTHTEHSTKENTGNSASFTSWWELKERVYSKFSMKTS